jgi:sugar/nucleoside kinase (ribokinase family)
VAFGPPGIHVACAGILVADVFACPIRRLPEAGELTTTSGFALNVGGCAANTAIALRVLGREVNVAGKVGTDMFGHFVLGELARHGAGVEHVRRTSMYPTSTTVIFNVKGEDRRYLHSIGANADFSLSDLDLDFLEDTRVLYMGGYLAMPSFTAEDLARLFREAKSLGVTTVLDVVIPASASYGIGHVAPVLPYTDYFLPNEDEAARLTGCPDARLQAACLSSINPRCAVVITRGDRGSLAMRGGRVIETPPFPMDTVDESGAGDAFTAGLIAGLLENWELEQALSLAAAVGASCTRALGCFAGVFTFDEAVAFLEEQTARAAPRASARRAAP